MNKVEISCAPHPQAHRSRSPCHDPNAARAANRERALSSCSHPKIAALKEEEEAKKFSADRKGQIGTGDRSEKIRTYNFPQDRITDHRIKESWHNIPKIMDGNIQPISDALHEFEKTGLSSGASAEEGKVGSDSSEE